ncbi:MAG: pyridoxamine 5'-phosphate oxidase family protein [Raoultibacter sp.]
MTYEMRRKDRELSEDQAREIIENGKYGVLSTVGTDGYPYGVPVHYACIDGKICFHSTAGDSRKADNFAHCEHVSFTVLEMDDDIKGRSAIAFGVIEKAPEQKEAIVSAIVEKFVPEFAWERAKTGIKSSLPALEAYALSIDCVSGKWIDKPEGR